MTIVFAVHIADGLLAWPWLVAGGIIALSAVAIGLRGLDEKQIPRVGLLTAAFFVSSQIHIPLPILPISVHLLLNGLVGVLLRTHAPVAIAIGLAMQAAMFAHGGYAALGVNACVQLLPALAAGWCFPWLRHQVAPFAAGAILGGATAALTVLLHVLVLWLGGIGDFRIVAGASFLAHLPVVAIEAILVGWSVRVLDRAKPDWLPAASAS